MSPERVAVPRDKEDDFSLEAVQARRAFAEQHAGTSLEHVSGFSFDPHLATGNVESFPRVAQVPIGLARPLLVHREHPQGEL